MKLIQRYHTTQWEYTATDEKSISSGVFALKEELSRPDSITIGSAKHKQVEICLSIYGNKPNVYPSNFKAYIKQITYNTKNEDLSNEFTEKEFSFLQNTYNFCIKENNRNTEIIQANNSHINTLYDLAGYFVFIESAEGEEFALIYFNRWATAIQPRGAAEDQLGEDVTFIHGIWENPLLTDEVIEKIKGQ